MSTDSHYSREELNRKILKLFKPFMISLHPQIFTEILTKLYGVKEINLMTLEQLAGLVEYMDQAVQIKEKRH